MLEPRDKLLKELFRDDASPKDEPVSTEGQGMMDLYATTQGLADEASSEGHEFHSDHTHSGTPDPAESPEGSEFHDDGFHREEAIEEAPPMTVQKAAAKSGFTLDDLRRSVIMKEILDRPVALRRRR